MEEYTYEDQVVDANLGDRPDLAYDNEALDVLTELFDNADNNIPDEILNTQNQDKLVPNHTLPDSPPYSGSEAYSPDSNNKLLSPSACSELSNPSTGYPTVSPEPPRTFQPDMNQHQQLHSHLIQQQQQLQQQQQMHQHLHERQLIQQQLLQQQAAIQNGGQLLVPPAALHMQRQHNGAVLPQMVGDSPPQQSYSPDQFSGKKRKFVSDSPPLTDAQFLQQQQLQQVKQEPVIQHPPHPQPPQACEFEPEAPAQSMDISPGMLNGGSYQPIKWREFQKSSWCPLINSQGQRVTTQTYRLDGDKGFNFSQIDKAFVCQKKNHFQITSCLSFSDAPQYVMSSDGPKPVEGFFMHFYGVKEEAQNQVIQVDQSQADRSKRKFDPVALHPNPEHSWKVTIGRLHFSDTTLNNMRKRGKPNPDQRYFLLVVGIFAHSQGKEYPVVQQCSEKLIVRASNPGQFQDSEAEPVKWQPGQTPNSVFHSGKVGINTDTPDEALTVAGNVKVMGNIMQPSDRRVKEDITEADTKEQLKNLQAISLYNYRYTEEFADAAGLDNPEQVETGVIAQELEVVIPEAVKTTTDVRLPNGEVIDSLKVVDKNRLFMESLGAVKELCNVTDSLENKINYLEKFNQKLKKLKRIGSMRSTASNESDLSRVTSISTVSHVTVRRKQKKDGCATAFGGKEKGKMEGGVRGVCSNRFLQILIFVLVFVMVACVGVILAMLYLDNKDEDRTATPSVATDGVGANEIQKGDPHRPTTPPSLENTPENWLLGPGCEEADTCEWDHCPNMCQGFFDQTRLGSLSTTMASPQKFEIMLGTTLSQKAGVPFKYEEQKSKTGGRRRRRSVGGKNPARELSISLISPVQFEINESRCLSCEEDSFNYTYGVQVSESFAGTNGRIRIALKDGNTNVPWRYARLCEVPTEPMNFFDKRCLGGNADVDNLFNVTPSYNYENQPLTATQAADFEVEVGKTIKNVVVFRVSKNNLDNVCEKDLSRNVVEFRVWFMRSCPLKRPLPIGYLKSRLDLTLASTTPPLTKEEGGDNIDDKLKIPASS